MRGAKIIIGLGLVAISLAISLACYVQSPGAGIAMGTLFTILIISFLYDHGRHIFFGGRTPAHPDLEKIRDTAIKHTRMTAMVEDGDLLTKR